MIHLRRLGHGLILVALALVAQGIAWAVERWPRYSLAAALLLASAYGFGWLGDELGSRPDRTTTEDDQVATLDPDG